MEKQSSLEYEANITIADTLRIHLLKKNRKNNLIATLASTFVAISSLSMDYHIYNYYRTSYSSDKSSIIRNYAPIIFNIGLYGTGLGLVGTSFFGAHSARIHSMIKEEKRTKYLLNNI